MPGRTGSTPRESWRLRARYTRRVSAQAAVIGRDDDFAKMAGIAAVVGPHMARRTIRSGPDFVHWQTFVPKWDSGAALAVPFRARPNEHRTPGEGFCPTRTYAAGARARAARSAHSTASP